MPQLRLNIFQRLVRQWEALHPYNAAQALVLRTPSTRDDAHQAFDAALRGLRLGPVRVAGERYAVLDLDGELRRNPVPELPPQTDLSCYLTEQFNRAFADDDQLPFRPFFLRQGPDAVIGMTYRHWVADSHSIRLIMQAWFEQLVSPGQPLRPLDLAREGYWEHFGPRSSRWAPVQTLLDSLRFASHARRARRMPTAESHRLQVSCRVLPPIDGVVGPLREAARRHGATINDLFLCAMAGACDGAFPRSPTSRRRDIALGTIVDLRPHGRGDLSRTFGLFLGYSAVVCRAGHLGQDAALIRSLAWQSRRNRLHGDHAGSSVRMMAGLTVGRWLSRRRLIDFYRHRTPLLGGISNVNLCDSWAAEHHPGVVQRYLRISPTGPMLPVVFCATTLNDRLDLSLTWRDAMLDADAADRLGRDFIDKLRSLAAS